MVELSKSIANKIKEKQGDITEDEVNEFLFLESTEMSLCKAKAILLIKQVL